MAAAHPRPTDFELDVLTVLWKRGKATVREVHDDVKPKREAGYTSVLKMLQIMTGKGLTQRTEGAKAHVYSAAASESETKRAMVEELAARLFGGSTAVLGTFALEMQPENAGALKKVRKALEKREHKAHEETKPETKKSGKKKKKKH